MLHLAVAAFGLCLGSSGEKQTCRWPNDGLGQKDTYEMASVPSEARGVDNMQDIDIYLRAKGLPTGLPVLRVEYDDGRVPLRGGGGPINNTAAAFLGKQPVVTWDASRVGTAAVAFVDFDCGGRRSDARLHGRCGPVLHSLWADCSAGSLTSCKNVVAYNPPGVSKGTKYVASLMRASNPQSPARPLPFGR